MVILVAACALLAPQEEESPLGLKVVNVRNAVFYKGPSRLSGVRGKAPYGGAVKVTAVKGRFAQATFSDGSTAWILKSALVPRAKFRPAASDEKEAGELKAQGYEASRGFDPETEAERKRTSGPAMQAAYGKVDALERRPVYKADRTELEKRLLEFRRLGKLGEFSAVQ